MYSHCIDNLDCSSQIIHKVVEYNVNQNDIGDGYLVVIHMKDSALFFGYKKDSKWYDESDKLIENQENIISFFDMPLPGFFKKRFNG
jgi:hypothetical protein